MIMSRLLLIVTFIFALISCSAPPLGETEEAVIQPTPGDTCQAAPVVTPTATPLRVDGRTTAKVNDYSTSYNCGDKQNSAADVVVAVNLPSGGILDAQVYATSTGFNPALYVRSDCAVEQYCVDTSATSETFRFEMPPGIHYVIVDGHGGTSGTFRLFLSLTPPTCGDGFVSPSIGEQCDVGAPIPGDGCGDPGTANQCQAEASNPLAEVPPGEPITLASGPNFVQGTTIGYQHDMSGTCRQAGAGSDRFYTFTAATNAVIDVWLGYDSDGATPACEDLASPYCWDGVLYLLWWNGTAWVQPTWRVAQDSLCSDVGSFYLENLHRTVFAGETYAIGIDGYDDQPYSRGPFNLRIDVQ
jgi:cysteine-rich repeat protein